MSMHSWMDALPSCAGSVSQPSSCFLLAGRLLGLRVAPVPFAAGFLVGLGSLGHEPSRTPEGPSPSASSSSPSKGRCSERDGGSLAASSSSASFFSCPSSYLWCGVSGLSSQPSSWSHFFYILSPSSSSLSCLTQKNEQAGCEKDQVMTQVSKSLPGCRTTQHVWQTRRLHVHDGLGESPMPLPK